MLHDNSIYEMKFTTSRRYGIIDSFGEKPNNIKTNLLFCRLSLLIFLFQSSRGILEVSSFSVNMEKAISNVYF